MWASQTHTIHLIRLTTTRPLNSFGIAALRAQQIHRCKCIWNSEYALYDKKLLCQAKVQQQFRTSRAPK